VRRYRSRFKTQSSAIKRSSEPLFCDQVKMRLSQPVADGCGIADTSGKIPRPNTRSGTRGCLSSVTTLMDNYLSYGMGGNRASVPAARTILTARGKTTPFIDVTTRSRNKHQVVVSTAVIPGRTRLSLISAVGHSGSGTGRDRHDGGQRHAI